MHWSCAITPVKPGELALAPYSAFFIRTFFAFGRRRVAAIGSRAHYRDSLAIAERLAAADRSNTQWQRDLSNSYKKVGDVLGRDIGRDIQRVGNQQQQDHAP
jgi:hypothetical protein